uniref:VC70-like protein-1 n=1 Tax=Halocynthia roretzi TaxID=7729 RepID=A4PBR0_HALRO|nr:VC70-like protein-1 [Halocynthia roretzi]
MNICSGYRVLLFIAMLVSGALAGDKKDVIDASDCGSNLCDGKGGECKLDESRGLAICTCECSDSDCRKFSIRLERCVEVSEERHGYEEVCTPDTCHNGGICEYLAGFPTCSCQPGFVGLTCDVYVNIPLSCSPNPCSNGGTCHEKMGGATCKCRPGFVGRKCEVTIYLPPSCTPNTCKNGGACTSKPGGLDCICAEGFAGEFCEDELSERSHIPSGDGIDDRSADQSNKSGDSVDSRSNEVVASGDEERTIGSRSNQRSRIHSGDGVDDRSADQSNESGDGVNSRSNKVVGSGDEEQTIENRANQVDKESSGLSAKSVTYGGFCTVNPCLNGGRCVEMAGRYSCQCVGSFSGSHCETGLVVPGINPLFSTCYPNPCLNGGACMNNLCACPPRFKGLRCESYHPITILNQQYQSSPCYPNPCLNGCNCIESCRHSSGYYCQSATGFLGKNCTVLPPALICDANAVILTVDAAFVREYEMGSVNIRLAMAQTADLVANAAPECYGTFDGAGYTFTLSLPFSGCGVNVDTSITERTVVTGTIWMNRILSYNTGIGSGLPYYPITFSNGQGFDMPVPVISFECTYTKGYTIITSLQPAIDQPQMIRGTGLAMQQGVIKLCKTPYSCPATCPQTYSVTRGAVYTVGEMIHLNIRGSPSLQTGLVAIRTLYLSCDGNSNAVPAVNLVTSGCTAFRRESGLPTVITHSGSSGAVCVSFQVPRLLNCAVFYIHAELENCAAVGCVPSGCSGRERREVRTQEDADASKIGDIFGPIFIIEGSRGSPYEVLFPDNSIVNSSAVLLDVHSNLGFQSTLSPDLFEGLPTSTLIIIVALIAFCIAVTTGVVIFIYRHNVKL